VIAHFAGVPVEEILPGLVSGVGAGLLLARRNVLERVRESQTEQSENIKQTKLRRTK